MSHQYVHIAVTDCVLLNHFSMRSDQCIFFFFNDTATTEIYTILFVGSVRCVQETGTWEPNEPKKELKNYSDLEASLINLSDLGSKPGLKDNNPIGQPMKMQQQQQMPMNMNMNMMMQPMGQQPMMQPMGQQPMMGFMNQPMMQPGMYPQQQQQFYQNAAFYQQQQQGMGQFGYNQGFKR
eukprot:TRINITY_DN368_c0_g2_i3.p1 TRINITY_DN368_c0_g2~~TRINITY_DN368_c0_g2_i3.p1  ORF type:complete len:180 (+),score=40.08 TRINITY_DN368_c0_g2_i3:3-542(+)